MWKFLDVISLLAAIALFATILIVLALVSFERRFAFGWRARFQRFRRAAWLALAALGFSLAACATASVHATIGRTLSAAQEALAGAEAAAHTSYQLGLVGKDEIRRIDALADKVDAVSMTARCAYAAGDGATVAGALSQMAIIAAAITAETSGKPVPNVPAFATLTCATPAPVAAVAAS